MPSSIPLPWSTSSPRPAPVCFTPNLLRHLMTRKIWSSKHFFYTSTKPFPSTSAGVRIPAVELEPSLAIKNKANEVAHDLKGTSIFLIGMNCSRKENLGKLLANALRYYYFSSDDLIGQATGGESAAISFQERDADDFRDSETEVLKQLSSMGRLVVCVGDGAVQISTNLAYMRHGISIWVDIPLDVLANEFVKTEASSSDSDAFAEVLEELSKSHCAYREGYGTADATISLQRVASQLGYEDLESVTPEDMAEQALKEIVRLTRVKKLMEEAARPF